MTDVKLGDHEKRALGALAKYYDSESPCLYFRGVAEETGLNLLQVKRAVRRLARKGLAEYTRGLFDEDGNVAGSGYCCTPAGLSAYRRLAEPADERVTA